MFLIIDPLLGSLDPKIIDRSLNKESCPTLLPSCTRKVYIDQANTIAIDNAFEQTECSQPTVFHREVWIVV